MDSFVYYNPVQIFFGNGVRKTVGTCLKGKYKNVLLVCSKGPFHENGLYEEISNTLTLEGIHVNKMGDVESNPKLFRIREGVEVCNGNGVDCIVALGAGSAIDCAKGIGAAARMKVDPYQLYWGERVTVTDSIDTVMIPTLAATGSELNRSSVAVNEETKEKYYFDSLHPKMAFMDPEITATVPIRLTIWGAMDILSHTFEFYFNGFTASEFQSRLSEGIILSVMHALEILVCNPADLNARGELLWSAAMTWGLGIAAIGRGAPDMACHGIEESFSGYFDTHHGACLGVLTPRWMEYVAPKRPDLFARFARNVFGITEGDERGLAIAGVKRYKQWLKKIGAPNVLSDIGNLPFENEKLWHVAQTACRIYNGGVGKMIRLTKEEVYALLLECKKAY